MESYLPKMSSFELLRAVYYMCLLGHFPSAPLERLLQSSTLEQFNTAGEAMDSLTHALSILLFSSLFFVFHLSLFFLFQPSDLPLLLFRTQVSP